MKQPVIVRYDPLSVISLPVGSVAVDTGDLVTLESNAIVLMDRANVEEVLFVGICGGKRGRTGDMLPIYTRCIISIDVTSATYGLGNGLKYTSKNTLVADGDADTIGWAFEDNSSSSSRILVYINVPELGLAADHLWDTVSA